MDERAFRFWCGAAAAWCLSVGALGAGLALFDTRALPLFAAAMNEAFWQTPVMPPAVVRYHRFMHGALGGVLAGWSVLMFFVARGPLRQKQPWAWQALAASAGTWFLLDSAASAWFGAWPNVALNAASILPLAVVLLRLRPAFAGPSSVLRQ